MRIRHKLSFPHAHSVVVMPTQTAGMTTMGAPQAGTQQPQFATTYSGAQPQMAIFLMTKQGVLI